MLDKTTQHKLDVKVLQWRTSLWSKKNNTFKAYEDLICRQTDLKQNGNANCACTTDETSRALNMQVQSEWKWAQKVDRALFVSPLPWMMKCTYGEWTHQTRICLQIHRHNNPINCVKMCSVQDTKGNQISQRMHSLHPAEVEDVALAHLVHCLFNSFFQGLHFRVLAALPSEAPCRSGSQVQFSWTILFFYSGTYPFIDVYSIAGTAPTGVAPGMAVSVVAEWTWDVTINLVTTLKG